jgi:hypothetical protein
VTFLRIHLFLALYPLPAPRVVNPKNFEGSVLRISRGQGGLSQARGVRGVSPKNVEGPQGSEGSVLTNERQRTSKSGKSNNGPVTVQPATPPQAA